jgi:DNA mismatch repair protein MutL
MGDSIIRKLPENLINKFAAGEVIERPASVVKELLENALDAGGADISVEVVNAGKDLIRITDNGTGMSREDLEKACERHTTSKIREDDDLFRVMTMGFRGEALAAIASVSELTIDTCRPGGEGYSLEYTYGRPGPVTPSARTPGTTVTVKNLFQNVPVRKKFMKTDATEFTHIADTVTRAALARPKLRLRLFHNTKEFLHFSPQREMLPRIAQVLGLANLDEYREVHFEDQSCSLDGVTGTLAVARKNWQGVYFFVNNRPVSGKSIFHGLKSGYGSNLPPGHFPAGVYFLKINFDEVDVNVHPSKAEIRFLRDQQVHQLIKNAVAQALGKANIAPAPGVGPGPDHRGTRGGITQPDFDQFRLRPSREPEPFHKPRVTWNDTEPVPVTELPLFGEPAAGITAPGPAPLVQYFQIHDTFILCQIKNGLMLIDQHVAHERILYEWVLSNLEKQQSLSQSLLFPLTIELEPAALAAVQGNLVFFRNVGFDLGLFGGNTIILRGVPPQLKNSDIMFQVREMIDYLLREETGGSNALDAFAKAYACGAAIKAGQTLSPEEMNHLVESLFQCQSPYSCPHGRPVVVKLKLDQINGWFSRS